MTNFVLVPVDPTEDMMEAFYDGAEEARNKSFEERRKRNEQRELEGKKPFPYGIAPIEWFPPAWKAALDCAPKSLWKTDLDNVPADSIVMIFDPQCRIVLKEKVNRVIDKGIRIAQKHNMGERGIRWIGVDDPSNWEEFFPTHYAELPSTP